jgi:dihydroxy-acid dehydratase
VENAMTDNGRPARRFRSRDWFEGSDRMDQTALYLERYMNYGITPDELRSGRPVVGIAQSGSDLSPCNRHHLELARRVRDGIRDAGGIPMEFPVHPIQETCRRPTAALDRNLFYLGLVEILHGYFIDAVVLDHGLRQDDAGGHHGGLDGGHTRHRALRRPDARRLVRGRAGRVGDGDLEEPPPPGRRPDR